MKDKYNAFQDYPWCFEYKTFKPKTTLFIYLERENLSWVNSFINNYGHKNGTHNCQGYWKGLINSIKNKQSLIDIKNNHKKQFEIWAAENNAEVLFSDVKNISWGELCSFTKDNIPKNIIGKTLEVPNVNSSISSISKKQKKWFRNLLWNFINPKKLSRIRMMFFQITGKRL